MEMAEIALSCFSQTTHRSQESLPFQITQKDISVPALSHTSILALASPSKGIRCVIGQRNTPGDILVLHLWRAPVVSAAGIPGAAQRVHPKAYVKGAAIPMAKMLGS
jgi:hypothetical protein